MSNPLDKYTTKPAPVQETHILLTAHNANYSLWRLSPADSQLEWIVDCHNLATARYLKIKNYPKSEILDHTNHKIVS